MSDDDLLLVSMLAPNAIELITNPTVRTSQLVEVDFIDNVGAIRPLISINGKSYGVIVNSKIILNVDRGTCLQPYQYNLFTFTRNDSFSFQMKPRDIFRFVADKLVFDSEYDVMCMKNNKIIDLGEGFEKI